MSRWKTVLWTFLSVAILLLLVVGGGVLYTWLMGKNPPKEEPPAVASAEVKANPLPEPTKPDPNAPVGVSVQSLLSPVPPGSNSSISINTTAEADCTIVVKYNEVASTDSGLVPKQADEYGLVSWTWTVEENVPEGTWPVEVTCKYADKSGFVRGDLVVEVEKE